MSFVSYFTSIFGYNSRHDDFKGEDARWVNDEARELSDINTFNGSSSRAFRRIVVGEGFNIRSTTQNRDFNKDFTRYIKLWSKKSYGTQRNRSNCEITGMYHFAEAQRQMADEYAVKSGGFIVAHHLSSEYKFGYKFELISLRHIDVDKSNYEKNIINGIEHYSNGEIRGIWIKSNKKNTTSEFIPYKNITLVVNKWVDIHQFSGVSPLKRVREALEYIDNYKAKEMSGAGRRADTPIIIKTPRLKEIFDAFLKEQKAEAFKNGGAIDEKTALAEFFSLNRLDNKNGSKKYDYISSDEEVYETGKAVDSIYEAMYKNEMLGSSSAIGLSAYSTSGIMHSSYNAGLKADSVEEDEAKIIAQDLVEGVIREMIEHYLLRGLLLVGKLSEYNITNINIDDFQDIKFIRVTKGHIDPSKTAKANTENVKVNNTKSMLKALNEQGIDYVEHLEEIEQYEIDMLKLKKRLKYEYEKAGIFLNEEDIESTINEDDLKDDYE